MHKFFKSFRFAFSGLGYAFKTQPNFRFELFCAFLVVGAGFFFEITSTEWIACLLCIGLVLMAELLNTALETLVDLVSPEYHKLAGLCKDLAAASVFIMAFFAAAVGLLIFVPYLLKSCA